tara:strand:+ start:1407 stop:2276 length:870 start_codon:yes stop_codon:yes gene_type:complete
MVQLDMVGYTLGMGSTDVRSAQGPSHIAKWLELNCAWPIVWHGMFGDTTAARQMQALGDIQDACQSLAQVTQQLTLSQKRWVACGGDHSAAIGTWSGAASAIDGPLGLIWFDAHLDAHTPETSHTKNIHGMPIACLLGHGPAELTAIQNPHPKLKPEHIHYIGVRDYEAEEMDFVRSQGVNLYPIEAVQTHGFSNVLTQVCRDLQNTTVGFGLSFDVDGLDPSDAPGVATTVDNGMRWAEVAPAINQLFSHPKLVGLEIVEYNPDLDVDGKTLAIVTELLGYYWQSYHM